MLNILRLSGFPIILLFTSTLFAQAAVLSEDYVSDHMDFLVERMTQEGPKTNLDHILTENAGLYGRAVNLTNFSDSELNLTQTSFDGIYLSEGMHSNTGYTRRDNSMSRLLPTSVLGNANLERLYTQNAALRNQSGIELPASFAPLVRFIKDYINANDFADSERANGITHQSLAVQIVRASFCFGNDPFMIASKMRQETSFKRSLISSGSAVGFSQMTGGKFGGIAEVRHQMSGNATLAPANALATYRQAIRCFTGLAPNQYTFPSGTDDAVKVRLRSSWAWDMIFGQIMTKALISYTKSSGQYPNNNAGNIEAYREVFDRYNGDKNVARNPVCIRPAPPARAPETPTALPQDSQTSSADSTTDHMVGPSAMPPRTEIPQILTRQEYACSVISHYSRMSAQWTRFSRRASGKDST